MSAKQHTEVLGTMSIGRLLIRIAVPSSVALFVMSTYNLVDAVFVGRGVGPEAIGALTLVFPFQMIIMAFGSLLGIGASSVVSRALGARQYTRAHVSVGTAFSTAVILGVLILIIGKIFLLPIIQLLGASGELIDLTSQYLGLILFIEPLIIFNFVGNALIRAEGQAKAAMITMIAGMLVNIALDPLFIFVFGWGVQGAAVATIIGRSVTFLLVLFYFTGKRSQLHITLKHLIPDPAVLKEIFVIGSSGFVRQVSTSLVHTIRNNLLVTLGGDIFVSAFGAVFRAIVFLGMPVMGLAQALAPIAGYNYGAGKYNRVRKALWVTLAACMVFTLAGFLLLMLAPQVLLRLFSSDKELLDQGTSIMRISSFVLLTFPAYFIAPSFYQALGKPVTALVLSLARPVLGLIITLAGARIIGVMGIVAADPIAVAAGALAAVIFLRIDLHKLSQPDSMVHD